MPLKLEDVLNSIRGRMEGDYTAWENYAYVLELHGKLSLASLARKIAGSLRSVINELSE